MNKYKEQLMHAVFLISACISIAAVVTICVFLFANGVPAKIEEMLFNLADNAVKYNRENGTVTITADENDSGKYFSVKDTGVGIPPEAQERVFERFYRVDKSHSRKIGGTGLGLSIVKHGAAFHNAEIQMNSTENVGTEITVTFKE